MKQIIKTLIQSSLVEVFGNELNDIDIKLSRVQNNEHGDYACNTAFLLAKKMQDTPLNIANKLVINMPSHPFITKVEAAGSGFINFFVANEVYFKIVDDILNLKNTYGCLDIGLNKRVHLEYVSVNPTGPLHIGHGRIAVYGSVLANCLTACGYKVHQEYYVNDAGRQMDILTLSVWLRYLEILGEKVPFPDNGYKGEYVRDIAQELYDLEKNKFYFSADTVIKDLQTFSNQSDPEQYIDLFIEHIKQLLGNSNFKKIHQYTLNAVIKDIKEDLTALGIVQSWFYESTLISNNSVEEVLKTLQSQGYSYEKDSAIWFKSSNFGDEKDRVLVRANGSYTYFGVDVAYHNEKFKNKFDYVFDIWGADHHGYRPRMRSAMQALGYDINSFNILLLQFVTLYRGNEKVQMSTRSGSFVTLRELREEVGDEATRFFYLLKKIDQHVDFDIELAKSQSHENPMYYIQYAHARICSVFNQLTNRKMIFNEEQGRANLSALILDHEIEIMRTLRKYPEILETVVTTYEPLHLTVFLKDLANNFHTYYNATIILGEDENLRNARLCLILAVKHVINNGLKLLGISAPEQM